MRLTQCRERLSFPYDEALRLARAVGVDLDAQVTGRLAEKKAAEIKLWDSATRVRPEPLGFFRRSGRTGPPRGLFATPRMAGFSVTGRSQRRWRSAVLSQIPMVSICESRSPIVSNRARRNWWA